MEPELEKNVIGFESGIGGQLGAPVAVARLQVHRRARARLAASSAPVSIDLAVSTCVFIEG